MDPAELCAALARAGLSGRRAVVHSSLSSFGHVVGGAQAVASALATTLETLLVPTCCWGEGSAECRPPEGEVWRHNGRAPGEEPRHVPVPFDPLVSLPVPAMGAISRAVLRLPGAKRGRHPLTSFTAVGEEAERYVAGQGNDQPQFPLEQLAEDQGYVVLLGVSLTRCTALHVAEERVGRRPFLRWVLTRAGQVEAVRVGGCSEGFERLWPHVGGAFNVLTVGAAEVRIAPLAELLRAAEHALRIHPSITRCDQRDCARCRDAALGGPSRVQ